VSKDTFTVGKNKIEKFSNKITLQEYNAENYKTREKSLSYSKGNQKTTVCDIIFFTMHNFSKTLWSPIYTPTFFKTNI